MTVINYNRVRNLKLSEQIPAELVPHVREYAYMTFKAHALKSVLGWIDSKS
ncbi:hypothetical protein [Endozoicomonas lisbonensis]|uniref:Uncharacterized protein n=1 Tax=Endozoicomonas lisbonensis TaxID=3120522 RepID=A0ABV2SP34_9GAMM